MAGRDTTVHLKVEGIAGRTLCGLDTPALGLRAVARGEVTCKRCVRRYNRIRVDTLIAEEQRESNG
jgi:hypothetical protein